ncbi:hypothetical protein PFISCL1PPCAC_27927, partial [Pristionchus fissidentatus]
MNSDLSALAEVRSGSLVGGIGDFGERLVGGPFEFLQFSFSGRIGDDFGGEKCHFALLLGVDGYNLQGVGGAGFDDGISGLGRIASLHLFSSLQVDGAIVGLRDFRGACLRADRTLLLICDDVRAAEHVYRTLCPFFAVRVFDKRGGGRCRSTRRASRIGARLRTILLYHCRRATGAETVLQPARAVGMIGFSALRVNKSNESSDTDEHEHRRRHFNLE